MSLQTTRGYRAITGSFSNAVRTMQSTITQRAINGSEKMVQKEPKLGRAVLIKA